MVAGCKTNSRLLSKIADIYGWLDLQICQNSNLAGKCDGCGRCCNFADFDHRLFVTTPELIYLAANLGVEELKPMATSRCPYNSSGKCTIYEYRFAGCRIFCCKGDSDFQSKLSESAVKRFKSICRELQIPYRYSDLASALSAFAGD
ncbi:MAG: YkgJ family cysteine cluster protein [Planctomycetota bacterium]|nr:MAG: YkgJ family cysteine cluster protein [Planctomycetota bacterium]